MEKIYLSYLLKKRFRIYRPAWLLNYGKPLFAEYLKAYDEASKYPWIIHYVGSAKPWQSEEVSYAKIWWEYAKMITNVLVQRCMAR